MPLNKSGVTPVSTAVQAEEKPKRSLMPKSEAIENIAKAETMLSLQPGDMKPEQKRIQRSGIWQAVVQSNALVQYAPTLDAFLDLVDKAADRGLQYVNRA